MQNKLLIIIMVLTILSGTNTYDKLSNQLATNSNIISPYSDPGGPVG